jgi:shikimate dehydrogenase
MSEEATELDRYGVMGHPVAHSRSPIIHQLFALQSGQQIRYELLDVEPAALEQAVRLFQSSGGKGLNITTPHKQTVCMLCDHLSERAATAGAANTLIFSDGEITGDNTDGIGLLRDLVINLELTIEDINVLILGAGGATRGVLGPLLEMSPRKVTIANRTLDKADTLKARFEMLGRVETVGFDDIVDNHAYDLIINATSASVRGESPNYPIGALGNKTTCYDLSYGLKPTPFTAWARDHGAARAVMGWGMLVEQAAESFRLWRGVRPETEPVLKQIQVSA